MVVVVLARVTNFAVVVMVVAALVEDIVELLVEIRFRRVVLAVVRVVPLTAGVVLVMLVERELLTLTVEVEVLEVVVGAGDVFRLVPVVRVVPAGVLLLVAVRVEKVLEVVVEVAVTGIL